MTDSQHRIAVYPGSFDPITNGHLDLIQRGTHLFDRLIVAIGKNYAKPGLFTIEERVALAEEAVAAFGNVEVHVFQGLAVDFVRAMESRTILRGIRTASDFEYEFQMALTNRALAPEVETVFVMASLQYSFISSRLVRDAAAAGGSIAQFTPPCVEAAVKRKLATPGAWSVNAGADD